MKASRRIWWCLTWGCVGLGSAGVVLPLLPTTPFLLAAAWAAPKASPRLAHWLETHPRYGPPLGQWREERAVPLKAKWSAVVLLCLSWSVLYLSAMPAAVLAVCAALFVGLAAYLVSRPLPRRQWGAREGRR